VKQWSAGGRERRLQPASEIAGFSPRLYELGNDPKYDSVYPYLFTHPGILVLKDFPLTESRFRVLRKSFSYEEIVEELNYCLGCRDSAEQIAWFVKDDLLVKDAFFLYPEVIRVVVEASIATIVPDQKVKQKLSYLYPVNPIFYIPDTNYESVFRAYNYLKKIWLDPRANFPKHLQPLQIRSRNEILKRLNGTVPAQLLI
jgi:hypothetical protein